MKNLITFFAICLISSILFSSCKSNMSVTKRLYNDGYYISYNKGTQPVHSPKKEIIIQAKTDIPEVSDQSNREQNTTDIYTEQQTITDNKVTATVNKNTQTKEISQQSPKQVLKHNAKIFENPVAQIKQTLSRSKITSGTTAVNDDLSLLWVVILVLIILWALGLISGGFGLGGLINILLVIALILLILWLLRVV